MKLLLMQHSCFVFHTLLASANHSTLGGHFSIYHFSPRVIGDQLVALALYRGGPAFYIDLEVVHMGDVALGDTGSSSSKACI